MSDAAKSIQNGANSGARHRAQASNALARRLNEALENDPQNGPGCIQLGNYVITYGTGDGEFAYHARDVERFLRWYRPVAREDREDGSDEPYSMFCAAVSPVESRRIALRIARELGRRICAAGSCRAILDDAEFQRAAASGGFVR